MQEHKELTAEELVTLYLRQRAGHAGERASYYEGVEGEHTQKAIDFFLAVVRHDSIWWPFSSWFGAENVDHHIWLWQRKGEK